MYSRGVVTRAYNQLNVENKNLRKFKIFRDYSTFATSSLVAAGLPILVQRLDLDDFSGQY